MRNLFLVLVLSNLAFAAWHRWFTEPSGTATFVNSTQVPGITLVSEVPEAVPDPQDVDVPPPVETPPVAEPVVADLPTERCISVGPFQELSQAATAAGNLRTAGYEPSQRVAEGDIWVGYWVYLPAVPSREEADEVLAALRANGVSDSYIVPGGESERVISLGVFSDISRAGNRREDVRRLGYEPTVVDRNRRGTVYWVDIVLDAEQTLDMDALQTPGRIIRLEQRSCDGEEAGA